MPIRRSAFLAAAAILASAGGFLFVVQMQKQASRIGDHATLPAASSPAFSVPLDHSEREAAAERGQALFFEQACWRCHTLGDAPLPGNQDYLHLGPDLVTTGERLAPAAIAQSILEPNAVIAEPKANHIDENGLSFMPPMGASMTENELHDLVVFLSLQKNASAPVNNVIAVNENTFEREALEADELVVLDFWAQWCLPCLELAPVLDAVATEFGSQVKICKIDVDENPELVAEYVPDNMFPCLVILRKGKLLDRRYGTDPKMEPAAFLRDWLGQHIASD